MWRNLSLTSGPAADPQNRITLGRTCLSGPQPGRGGKRRLRPGGKVSCPLPTGGDRLPPGRSPTPPFPVRGYEGRFTALLESTKAKLPSTPLGVLVADDSPLAPALFQLAQEGTVDFLLPQVTHATGADGRLCGIPSPLGRSRPGGGNSLLHPDRCGAPFHPLGFQRGSPSSPGELAAQWEIGWELGSSGFLPGQLHRPSGTLPKHSGAASRLPSKNP